MCFPNSSEPLHHEQTFFHPISEIQNYHFIIISCLLPENTVNFVAVRKVDQKRFSIINNLACCGNFDYNNHMLLFQPKI